MPRSALPPNDDLAARASRSPLLVALDIDGTLAPIAPTPAAAAIPEATRRTLERFARVARRASRLRHRPSGAATAGVSSTSPHSWTIGNHGIELIDPTGALRVNAVAEAFGADDRARSTTPCASRSTASRVCFVEDKTWTLSVHYPTRGPSDVPRR